MVTRLPLKTIRKILKENVKGEVSLEACLYAKAFCENILKELAIASNLELQEENRLRQIQNLPIRKRIDGSIFKKVSHHLFKQTSDVKTVEQDRHNKELFYEDAVEVT